MARGFFRGFEERLFGGGFLHNFNPFDGPFGEALLVIVGVAALFILVLYLADVFTKISRYVSSKHRYLKQQRGERREQKKNNSFSEFEVIETNLKELQYERENQIFVG